MNKTTIIYDEKCSFCKKWVDWTKERDENGVFEFLPCESQERTKRFPEISTPDCLAAMYLVTPAKTLYRGADALPKILRELPRWKYVSYLLSLPGISLITWPVYKVIAKNRYRFGCDTHSCKIK